MRVFQRVWLFFKLSWNDIDRKKVGETNEKYKWRIVTDSRNIIWKITPIVLSTNFALAFTAYPLIIH